MTSQGSPYARFRRAIERDNVITAEAAARELGWLSLPDALAYCLLLLGRDPARYRRAALRWHARWEKEVGPVKPAPVATQRKSLAALGSVPDEKALKLLQALAEREGRRRMKTARRAGR